MTRAFDMPAALRRALVALFVAAALSTLYFAFVGRLGLSIRLGFLRDHQVLHLAAFACLALVGFLLWAPLVAVASLLVVAGGVVEVVQFFVPSRQPSWFDFATSASGVILGALLYGFVAACWAISGRLP